MDTAPPNLAGANLYWDVADGEAKEDAEAGAFVSHGSCRQVHSGTIGWAEAQNAKSADFETFGCNPLRQQSWK